MGVPALRLVDISKTFGGSKALDEVSFEVRPGTIHALLGGNGSGKSSLIKVLAGVYEADPGGSIEVFGSEGDARGMTPAHARRLGLRFVHQNPGLFASMSVADNLALGPGFITRGPQIRHRRQRKHAVDALTRLGMSVNPRTMVRDLRPAEQTMVAIARALQDISPEAPSILVLDEPTASLPAHEVEVFFAAVRALVRDGQTVIFVSHRIDEVLALADVVTILRDGHHVITRDRDGLDEDSLVEYIVGRRLDRVFPPVGENLATEEPVLTVDNLGGGPLTDVTLQVHPGEVVGIAGLLGSGRSELLRMILGDLPHGSGTISIAGEAVRVPSVSAAMKRGVGFVPEDRGADAAFPDLSIRENLSIARVRDFWRVFRLDRRGEVRDSVAAIIRYLIKAKGPSEPLSTLSGGNQQKVVLARWLARDPRLLLLDEPTQGVDVGARADLYSIIRERVNGGVGALIVSSDFDELARACDRVLVLSGGRIVAEAAAPHLDSGRLTELVYLAGAVA